MRPSHWLKNAFVFAALVFAGKLSDPRAVGLTVLAFAAFCLLSSMAYIVNDLADAEDDRRHPVKRERPIAAGLVARGEALWLAGACFVAGAVLCLSAGWPNFALLAVGLAYVGLSFLYTYWAKHYVLIDVLCIASGFVLRSVAGGAAIWVPVSRWLLACTFTLCMFLGFAKRRCELAASEDRQGALAPKAGPPGYGPVLLEYFLGVSAALAIVTFLLYTVDVASPPLFFSVPLVVFCIFRVWMLVEAGKVQGPTEAVTRDVPFIVAFVLWAVYAGIAVTWGGQLQEAAQGLLHWLQPGGG